MIHDASNLDEFRIAVGVEDRVRKEHGESAVEEPELYRGWRRRREEI